MFEFKIVIIGSPSVGKSAITNRIMYQRFESDYTPTIGAGYVSLDYSIDGKVLDLQIWDTAGMEKYQSLSPVYYRNAKAAIFVYDQTNIESADSISKWFNNFKDVVKNQCYLMLVANKSDLNSKSVSNNYLKDFQELNKMDFIETSAKTGEGINELISLLARGLLKNLKESDQFKENLNLNLNKKKNCC